MEFLKKISQSRWLPWLGLTPFALFPILMVFDGQFGKGTGTFLFFASAFAGILLAQSIGRVIDKIFVGGPNFNARICAALSVFGFLFLPPLVGTWTNLKLGTEIEMHSLLAHFLWAAGCAVVVFCIPPSNDRK